MFERFTDRARNVMALANQEAQRFNHEYIGTEHILLGLIKEGTGVGATVLKEFGVDLRLIRLEVEKMVKSGPDVVPMGKLPHTPLAKTVIEQAILAARSLNHHYVGTEHLLLGLLAAREGIAHMVLDHLGVKPDQARQRVLAMTAPGTGVAGDVPLSSVSELVLDHARAEARQLARPVVDPAHLLLAMARLDDDIAGRILREHGVTYDKVLERLPHERNEGPGQNDTP